MNNSTLIFLVNKKARAIACVYDPDNHKAGKETPKIWKTLDPTITVDDYVVIPTGTRHNMTCVKVIAVDVQLDIDTTEQIGWIVDRVDHSKLQKLEADEAALISAVHNAERLEREDRLRETLMKAVGQQAGTLAIIDMSPSGVEFAKS